MIKRGTILDAIGNTPLIQLDGIWAKCEYLNPSGSLKDRIARYIIEKAEKTGKLSTGDTIVEATSGNTGTALALVAALKGYKIIIFIPKGLTEERYKMMRAFGADVRLIREGRFDLAIQQAKRLGQKKGYYHTNQFANPWNPEEHMKHLGPEILDQLHGKTIDAVVNGIGTGGTIIGLGKYFRKHNSKVLIYGVEPHACASTYETMHQLPHECKPHHIEGIGDSLVPPIVKKDINILTDIVRVKSADAIREAKRIAQEHGCFVGISSGANLIAARLIQQKNPKIKTIVTILCDEGEKYLSEPWFAHH